VYAHSIYPSILFVNTFFEKMKLFFYEIAKLLLFFRFFMKKCKKIYKILKNHAKRVDNLSSWYYNKCVNKGVHPNRRSLFL
jgi:hypothetical protein